MNYKDYIECENKYCNEKEKKIHIDLELIKIQQKIINAKSLNTQSKYIKTFNDMKSHKNHVACMINNCRFNLIIQYKDRFEFYKNKLKKQKKLTITIKKSIEICRKLFIINLSLPINLDNIYSSLTKI